MIDVLPDRSLAEFAHRGLPDARDRSRRLPALAATALFYAALLLATVRGFDWTMPPRPLPSPAQTFVRVLPPAPMPRMTMRDFTVRLVGPRLENAPMPQIVISPDVSAAPKATLPVTAVLTSAMAGGANGSAAGSVSGVGTGGSGAGVAACMDAAYLDQIRRHVARWYLHPMEAERQTGIAYVHFVIDRSGHYRELSLARSTGNIWLDRAAMRTMQLAQPLPPIPERLHTDRLNGLFPIIYQLRGVALRAQQLGADANGC